jgi:hypothetical protein
MFRSDFFGFNLYLAEKDACLKSPHNMAVGYSFFQIETE